MDRKLHNKEILYWLSQEENKNAQTDGANQKAESLPRKEMQDRPMRLRMMAEPWNNDPDHQELQQDGHRSSRNSQSMESHRQQS
jgi:hypothetical protein